jgi:hypothetical protein
MPPVLLAFTALLSAATATAMQTTKSRAEVARWMLHETSWGYISLLEDSVPQGSVLSFSDGNVHAADPEERSTGRLFFYIMNGSFSTSSPMASLTVSEAAFNGTCGFAGSKIDPEDPRCAKVTVHGALKLASGADAIAGRAALYSRHPQMRDWPVGHHFQVYLLDLDDVWMLDTYGGGGSVPLDEYFAVQPKNSRAQWPPAAEAPPAHGPWLSFLHTHALLNWGFVASPAPTHGAACTSFEASPGGRARSLVNRATWASVSTLSVRLGGAAWGNVRSLADGVENNSTGLPVLYLPSPDPTSEDISHNPSCSITMSEAALPAHSNAASCGTKDPEDPTCGRVSLSGKLRALKPAEIAQAEASLSARHPLAPWLSAGGAHTGGQYYTIELETVTLLDHYGGPTPVSVKEYLDARPTVGVCHHHAHASSMLEAA